MNTWHRTRKLALAFVLGIAALGAAAPQTALAGTYHQPRTTYRYKTVTKWVTKQVPYKKQVVLYDCGKPYTTYKTYYKTVKVPVTYKVRVSSYH